MQLTSTLTVIATIASIAKAILITTPARGEVLTNCTGTHLVISWDYVDTDPAWANLYEFSWSPPPSGLLKENIDISKGFTVIDADLLAVGDPVWLRLGNAPEQVYAETQVKVVYQ